MLSHTNVPFPLRISTTFLDSNILIASRTVPLPTPNFSTISISFGSFSPSPAIFNNQLFNIICCLLCQRTAFKFLHLYSSLSIRLASHFITHIYFFLLFPLSISSIFANVNKILPCVSAVLSTTALSSLCCYK